MKKIKSPSIIRSVGNKPKIIEEFIGVEQLLKKEVKTLLRQQDMDQRYFMDLILKIFQIYLDY